MIACFEKPRLELIEKAESKERIEKLSSSIAVGTFAEENQARLKELERERDLLAAGAALAGMGISVATVFVHPLSAIVLPSIELLMGKLQGASQRFNLMSQLVEAFENEDIQITVGLQPEGLRDIDLFLRFPDKEFILIQIRSLGNSKVFFNEKKEALQFRRRGGGLKTWKPDPLGELIEQERWLRKHRPDLLGGSSRDKRRPISKLLVLSNITTLDDHSEQLYNTIGEQKYLTIRKTGTVSIVTKDQVLNFVGDYLQSRRSTKGV